MFAADIKEKGVYYYSAERVEQLKSVYHKGWQHETYNRAAFKPNPDATKQHENIPEQRRIHVKISDDVISAIKFLEPSALEAHGYLTAAPKMSMGEQTYICPHCNSGSGPKGTGMVVYRDADRISYHCYACGDSFDNISIIAEHYGLNNQSDFVEICTRAASDFGIPCDSDPADFVNYHNFTNSNPTPPPKREPPPPDPALIDLIRADIQHAQDNLFNIPDNWRRGLSFETLQHFGCGFIPNWTHPKSRLRGTKLTATPRLIIPSGNAHYLARLTVPEDMFKGNFDSIAPKAHAGSKDIFLSHKLSELTDIDFIVVFEGEIDAMTCWQCTGAPVAATCGASSFQPFVDLIAAAASPPRVFIVFDPDDTGRVDAANFLNALLDAGVPAITRFLTDDNSKLDLNDILCTQGQAAVEDALHKILLGDDLNAAWIDANNQIAERKARKALTAESQTILISTNRADSPVPNSTTDLVDKLFKLPPNDIGNARRIALLFGDRVRFMTKAERWLLYDAGTWDVTTKSPSNLYSITNNIQGILQANKLPLDKCEYADALVAQWGKKSKICAAIELLKGEPNIPITRDDLNSHYHLLNVQNGVVDLRTGELHPHDSSLLFTQKINVPYLPGFRSDTVEKFFRSVVPDDATRAALLRFLGYCLTGECSEEQALFIWGKGGNGKGTLTNMLMNLFGDFACAFPIKAVLKNPFEQGADAATPAFSMLQWARLAIAEEIPAGAVLDFAKFKLITGRDPIPVRPLYGEYSVIKRPTHTMIFSGNYLPELKDPNDTGIQRRLLNINFDQDFTQNPDVHLKDRLVEEDSLKALLALLVAEAVAYYRDGLIVSDGMRRATAEYLADQDFIAEFISENCEYAENASIPRPALVKRIKAECDSARDMSNKAISSALERLPGLKKVTIHGTIHIKGLRWRDAPEQQEMFGGDY